MSKYQLLSVTQTHRKEREYQMLQVFIESMVEKRFVYRSRKSLCRAVKLENSILNAMNIPINKRIRLYIRDIFNRMGIRTVNQSAVMYYRDLALRN